MAPILFPLSLDPAWLTAVLLITLRLGAIFVATPILAEANIPAMVRVLLVVAIAVALTGSLPQASVTMPQDFATLLSSAVGELALGAAMALGILLAFGGFSLGGRLLDVQTGFAVGQVFDPVSRQPLTVLTAALNRLAVVVFFCLNGPGLLLRALAISLERFPPGQPWPLGIAALPILKQAATAFAYGFSLAAPLVLCLLLLDFGLGVLARNLPQMNIFMLGLPIKTVCGLFALALWLPATGHAMTRLYESIFVMWQEWMRHG